MKKIFLFVVAALCSAIMFAQSGTCGDDLNWSYNSGTKTLTISGTGTAMTNFASMDVVPWKDYCADIEAIVLPDGLKQIGTRAFSTCSSITSVTLPESIEIIGNRAFYQCYALSSINLPAGLDSIGTYAFYHCEALTSLTLPEGLRIVEKYALSYCGLTTLTIPASVLVFEGNTGLPNLESFTVAAANPNYCSVEGVLMTKAQDSILSCPRKKIGTFTIPSTVTKQLSGFGYCQVEVIIPAEVKKIKDGAFSHYRGENLNIPSTIEEISGNAFLYAPNINYNGTLKDASMNTLWGAKACNAYKEGNLYYTDNSKTTLEACTPFAKSVEIPASVTKIDDMAFAECDSLEEVEIPANVSEVGLSAFYSMTSLKHLTIPNTVTSTMGGSFNNCNALESIQLQASCTTLAAYCFSKCYALDHIDIPEGVTTIGTQAFEYCPLLTDMVFPSTLAELSVSAAVTDPSNNWTSITCKAVAPPTVGVYTFTNINKSIPLYVPAASVATYKAKDCWKDFTNILPISATALDDTSAEPKSIKRIVNGQLLIERDGKTFNAQGIEVK